MRRSFILLSCLYAACAPQGIPAAVAQGSPVRPDAPGAPLPPPTALASGSAKVAPPAPAQEHMHHGGMSMPAGGSMTPTTGPATSPPTSPAPAAGAKAEPAPAKAAPAKAEPAPAKHSMEGM